MAFNCAGHFKTTVTLGRKQQNFPSRLQPHRAVISTFSRYGNLLSVVVRGLPAIAFNLLMLSSFYVNRTEQNASSASQCSWAGAEGLTRCSSSQCHTSSAKELRASVCYLVHIPFDLVLIRLTSGDTFLLKSNIKGEQKFSIPRTFIRSLKVRGS